MRTDARHVVRTDDGHAGRIDPVHAGGQMLACRGGQMMCMQGEQMLGMHAGKTDAGHAERTRNDVHGGGQGCCAVCMQVDRKCGTLFMQGEQGMLERQVGHGCYECREGSECFA